MDTRKTYSAEMSDSSSLESSPKNTTDDSISLLIEVMDDLIDRKDRGMISSEKYMDLLIEAVSGVKNYVTNLKTSQYSCRTTPIESISKAANSSIETIKPVHLKESYDRDVCIVENYGTNVMTSQETCLTAPNTCSISKYSNSSCETIPTSEPKESLFYKIEDEGLEIHLQMLAVAKRIDAVFSAMAASMKSNSDSHQSPPKLSPSNASSASQLPKEQHQPAVEAGRNYPEKSHHIIQTMAPRSQINNFEDDQYFDENSLNESKSVEESIPVYPNLCPPGNTSTKSYSASVKDQPYYPNYTLRSKSAPDLHFTTCSSPSSSSTSLPCYDTVLLL